MPVLLLCVCQAYERKAKPLYSCPIGSPPTKTVLMRTSSSNLARSASIPLAILPLVASPMIPAGVAVGFLTASA